MNNQELDEAVARKLGWKDTPGKAGYATHWSPPDRPPYTPGMAEWDAPPYSTDIKAAWEIVEHLQKEGFSVWVITWDIYVACEIGPHENPIVSASADTTPPAPSARPF